MQVTKVIKQIVCNIAQGKVAMVPWGRVGLLCVTVSVKRLGGNRIREITTGNLGV
jgi:hypothetical protein